MSAVLSAVRPVRPSCPLLSLTVIRPVPLPPSAPSLKASVPTLLSGTWRRNVDDKTTNYCMPACVRRRRRRFIFIPIFFSSQSSPQQPLRRRSHRSRRHGHRASDSAVTRDQLPITRLRAASKFPRIPARTKKYQSCLSYALAHYQT